MDNDDVNNDFDIYHDDTVDECQAATSFMKYKNSTMKNTNIASEVGDGLDVDPDPLLMVFVMTAQLDMPTATQPQSCNGYTFKSIRRLEFLFVEEGPHPLHIVERGAKGLVEDASI